MSNLCNNYLKSCKDSLHIKVLLANECNKTKKHLSFARILSSENFKSDAIYNITIFRNEERKRCSCIFAVDFQNNVYGLL